MNGDRPRNNGDAGDKQRPDGSSDSKRVLDSKPGIFLKDEKGTPSNDSPNTNRDDKNEHNAKSDRHEGKV